MKDLDFDELDKAVNSVMGGSPTKASAADSPKVEESPEIVEAPSSEPVESEPTAVAGVGSLAARRGGRFMDVVHSSSDMTKTPTQQPPVSRNSSTITPPERPSVAPVVEVEPVIEAQSPEEQDELLAPPQLDTWPDPIELEQGVNALEAEPLTSPFLPNTKVEKRPLGGSSDDQSAVETPATAESSNLPPSSDSIIESNAPEQPAIVVAASTVASTTSAWGAKLPETDPQLDPSKDTKPTLPAELDSNLVAIESGEITPKTSETPSLTLMATGKKLTGGSIPQQYTEQPSTTEPDHAAIYDTSDAHQPLAHPSKKKSSWLWVILIVGFAVAGCGIGAALYFMGII